MNQLLSLLRKTEVGLFNLPAAYVYVSVCMTPVNFWMTESVFMNLAMYMMTPEFISTAYFISPSHKSEYLYV
jgi:hypothetical protein